MITYKENTYDSWKDVVKSFPAMWVVFSKVDFDGTRVKAGNIWVILPDEEIIDFENEHYDDIALSLRTTETTGVGGYIHGEIVDA